MKNIFKMLWLGIKYIAPRMFGYIKDETGDTFFCFLFVIRIQVTSAPGSSFSMQNSPRTKLDDINGVEAFSLDTDIFGRGRDGRYPGE